jgi:hypothetical protein
MAEVAEMGEEGERGDGGRDAAAGQPADDPPLDRRPPAVDSRTGDLGDGGEQEIGADRGLRADAEQQHEKRRHQRAAADPGEADEHPDEQPGDGVQRVDMRKKAHAAPRGALAAGQCPANE